MNQPVQQAKRCKKLARTLLKRPSQLKMLRTARIRALKVVKRRSAIEERKIRARVTE